MKQINKLYIITHDELTPGQQIAQVAHATSEFAANGNSIFNKSFNRWFKHSKYIIVLSVPTLAQLKETVKILQLNGVKVYQNYEPDLSNELTAVATNPDDFIKCKKLLRHLKLALSK